ncbi:MAG: YeeE/YedE family protein [Bdellovibrionaceae bacterium]|nr:YeeE/YedE family protein [Pseudobdellovibrionaceae bacterium]
MRTVFSAGLVGLLFSLGLGLAGMTRPEKVIGFLDVFGEWDPSLAFVMIGAIGVHLGLYRLVRQRTSPVFSSQWFVPNKTKITRSLVFGAILFGMGWGLAGYCPGPAITSLASFQQQPLIFVISMIVGMTIFKIVDRKFKFNR